MATQDSYWQKTRRLTLWLLVVWSLLTFVMSWYARELNKIAVFDFPLGFYIDAQGALFVYLAIIWYYNRCMRKLEAKYGIEDD